MELNARQLIALAGPLVIGYLTWSAVSGGVASRPLATPNATSVASVTKRPQIGELTRDPFARDASSLLSALGAAAGGEEGEGDDTQLHLNGTVLAGRWRMAIINGTRVFEGQTFRGMQLTKVASDAVTLRGATGEDVRLALEIAPAAPLAKAPGAAAGPGAARTAPGAAGQQATPIQKGIDALKSGGGADLLQSLGIPQS
jgi:hypothetical protein